MMRALRYSFHEALGSLWRRGEVDAGHAHIAHGRDLAGVVDLHTRNELRHAVNGLGIAVCLNGYGTARLQGVPIPPLELRRVQRE